MGRETESYIQIAPIISSPSFWRIAGGTVPNLAINRSIKDVYNIKSNKVPDFSSPPLTVDVNGVSFSLAVIIEVKDDDNVSMQRESRDQLMMYSNLVMNGRPDVDYVLGLTILWESISVCRFQFWLCGHDLPELHILKEYCGVDSTLSQAGVLDLLPEWILNVGSTLSKQPLTCVKDYNQLQHLLRHLHVEESTVHVIDLDVSWNAKGGEGGRTNSEAYTNSLSDLTDQICCGTSDTRYVSYKVRNTFINRAGDGREQKNKGREAFRDFIKKHVSLGHNIYVVSAVELFSWVLIDTVPALVGRLHCLHHSNILMSLDFSSIDWNEKLLDQFSENGSKWNPIKNPDFLYTSVSDLGESTDSVEVLGRRSVVAYCAMIMKGRDYTDVLEEAMRMLKTIYNSEYNLFKPSAKVSRQLTAPSSRDIYIPHDIIQDAWIPRGCDRSAVDQLYKLWTSLYPNATKYVPYGNCKNKNTGKCFVLHDKEVDLLVQNNDNIIMGTVKCNPSHDFNLAFIRKHITSIVNNSPTNDGKIYENVSVNRILQQHIPVAEQIDGSIKLIPKKYQT